MVHTRSLSVSETSSLPTHPWGLRASRANSSCSAAGHSLRSFRSACFSDMVRAMEFLRWCRYGEGRAQFDTLPGALNQELRSDVVTVIEPFRARLHEVDPRLACHQRT